MMAAAAETIDVLCVDDNKLVAEALRIKLSRSPGFSFGGWLPSADALLERAADQCPHFVLLDLDMPGKDPLAALGELVERCPEARVVIFSGHVRKELIDRALEVGAWGYVSKNDGDAELLLALRQVAKGELGLSPEVRTTSAL